MSLNTTNLIATIDLSYEERGSGTPLVLLHGYPLDHTIWREQITALSSEARVIAPDLRGHGATPAPTGAYSMDLMARDVLDLLDRLKVEKAVFAGHSMGSYVTFAAYHRAPERFLGMALVAGNYKADTEEARQKRLDTAAKVIDEGVSAAYNPNMFADSTPAKSPLRAEADRIMKAARMGGVVGTLQGMAARPSSEDLLPKIDVPAAVIAGEGDKIFKLEMQQEMAQLMPNARFTVVPNAGHLLMLEQPQAVNDALRALLKRIEA